MNEFLFFVHLFVVLVFGLIALRLGKTALVSWVSLQAVLANLFVLKQMSFCGFEITCSDVYAIGSILGLNILREYFGKQPAASALYACFFSMIFFVLMAQFHLLYSPSSSDQTQPAYQTLLSSSPRLLFASLAAFLTVQRVDLYLFSLLKEKLPRLSLNGRNAIALVFTQFLDTLLFSILGLWGLVSSLTDIIAMSFLVKVAIISSMTLLMTLLKRLIPHRNEVA